MAQLAVAAPGAAIGAFQVGWRVGLFIGSQLFVQKQKVEGPRLGDLQVQASTYGMGIPLVFGSMRLAGATDIESEENQAEVGGKGFGDGPGVTTVSYSANSYRYSAEHLSGPPRRRGPGARSLHRAVRGCGQRTGLQGLPGHTMAILLRGFEQAVQPLAFLLGHAEFPGQPVDVLLCYSQLPG